MKKSYLLTALLPFLLVSVAYAHGPVRQKVDEEITINAPAAKVWGIIKEFGDMSWLPPVKSTDGKGGNGDGATRTLTLQSGGIVTEELKKYDDAGMMYQYKITDMSSEKTINHSGADVKVPVVPVDNYAATIKVEDKGGSSVVTWKAGFYRAYTNNNPPPEMNEEAANTAINGIFKAGLDNLKKLAEK
jgi:Polyketide cyclase / dehydrase and lipid transport